MYVCTYIYIYIYICICIYIYEELLGRSAARGVASRRKRWVLVLMQSLWL